MKRFLPLLIASLGLSFGQVSAQYIVDDACATPFEDISGTGTALGLVDDGETNVTLPFDFTLYDITSTDVRIGNNGGMIFNATTGDLFALNDPLPTVDWTSGIVAFWDDLDNETGDVYIETRGTAPFRRFIVQWHMRPHFNNIGDATLQAILYESTNQIRFVYDDIDFGDPAFNDGVSATIGLQKDGTTADQYSFNSSIAGVNCILFSPPITAVCQDVTVQLDATGNYTFDTPLTPQVDAEQLIPAGSTTDFVQLQTFTATQGGLLHSVSVQLAGAYSSGQLWVDLWDGDLIAGTVPQLSNTVVTSAVPPGLTEFIIDAPVEVVAGNTYTWVLYDATSTTGVNLSKNDGNLYAGGYNQTSLTSDFVFRTKILQRPEIDNGTTDSDGLQSFGLSQTSFTCADAGLTVPVTLTVTDNLGNSGACVANVTVEDNEFPVANCQNANAFLDATGNATITASAVNNGSTDNCSGLTFSASQTTFSCGDVGVVPVTLTVSDASGNTDNCSANVNVTDGLAPNALCQNHTLILDGSGSGTLVVANVNNGSTDNCGIDSYSLSQTAFNCSNIGANTVTLTVEDLNGNTSSCNATVTVEDNQAPVVNCPANIVVCADDASGAVVTYPAVTGSDNCTYVITQTDVTGLTSGSNFPLGVTTLTYTNTDSPAGNSTSCSFDITVNPTPVADYTHSAACEGEATFFTDESTIDASSSITNWQWDMGDGSSPIGLVDPIHAFADTGSYDVELVVTSAEGCTDTTTQSVYVGLVPSASFTVANGCEGQPTSFTNTSSIGAGTLTYAWDFGDSNTSTDQDPSHTYALDGTYTVTLTVTSDNGCEDTFTGSVEVYDSPTALFTASTACFGTATSFTNLSTGGGTPTYAWDFGDSNTSTSTNPTHTYTTAGTYTVTLTVTNSNNCVSVSTVLVTVNALPTVDFTFSDVCEGTAASFVNSSSPGSYNWDLGDNTSSTLTNVSHVYNTFGVYDVTLTVTDANFCINSATQQIEIYDLPDFTLTPTDVACYGEATGNIVTNPVGSPTFPWDFILNNGTPQINDTFLGLPAGSYDVTVVDANGCEFTVSTDVNQPNDTLGIDISALVDVLCNGESTGEINIMGTGGTSPYTYSVNAGSPQATGDFSGLPAGAHDIQIVDANSCVFDTIITLTEPDTLVLAYVNSEDLLCNGDNSGELAVVGTGGVAPYEYNLDGGVYGSDSAFYGLAAGTYIVGVLDANGCTDTLHVTLTEPGVLMLSLLDAADANCFGESNGHIEVGASSGTPGYQYSLDGVNFQGSGLFEGLAAGTYTVTVVDANGCTASLTETIFEPALLTIETNSEPVACFGEATGEIEIIADGGTPGYEYSIDEGDNFFANGGTFTDLATGNFIAVVMDANGCTASEGVVVSQPSAAFDLQANVEDALCLDSASGVITLIGNGGTPTYSYSDDNSTFVSGNVFSGFAAGNYTLYAQDVNGCADSVTFNVGQPATAVSITNILLNNPACPNTATGTATVLATGGTPGYMYSSNAGNTYQTNSILTGINGGNHLIVVQDANGCIATDTITLTSPPLLNIDVDSIIGVDCEGDIDGEIHVVASGGTPSYNYTLNGASLQSNGNYINLTDGTYTIQITDVNGCTFSEDFVVPAAQMQPIAEFTWTSSGTAVLFTNQSEFGDSYLWDFGDNTTSTDENPVHVYAVDGIYSVSLTVTNECGETTVSNPVNTLNTGIDEADDISFNLYPNPATYELNLLASKAIRGNLTVDVVSTSGQLIRSEVVTGLAKGEITQVNINGLAQGIYYLRLVADQQQTVLRFDIIK